MERVHGAKMHPETAHFVPLIQSLGPGGQSGDESDRGNGNGGLSVYHIVQDEWRAPEIRNWLEVFSLLHLSGKWNKVGRRKRGNFPRFRRFSKKKTEGNPVVGLPVNFYDPVYLKGLTDFERRNLQPKPAVDISHSNEVLECVLHL